MYYMCKTCILQVFYTCFTCVWITCIIHLKHNIFGLACSTWVSHLYYICDTFASDIYLCDITGGRDAIYHEWRYNNCLNSCNYFNCIYVTLSSWIWVLRRKVVTLVQALYSWSHKDPFSTWKYHNYVPRIYFPIFKTTILSTIMLIFEQNEQYLLCQL